MRLGSRRYRFLFMLSAAAMLSLTIGCEERVVRSSGFYTPQEGWGTKQPTKVKKEKQEPGWFDKYPDAAEISPAASLP